MAGRRLAEGRPTLPCVLCTRGPPARIPPWHHSAPAKGASDHSAVANHDAQQPLGALLALTLKLLKEAPAEPIDGRAAPGHHLHTPIARVEHSYPPATAGLLGQAKLDPASSRHSRRAAISSRLPRSILRTATVGRHGTETSVLRSSIHSILTASSIEPVTRTSGCALALISPPRREVSGLQMRSATR